MFQKNNGTWPETLFFVAAHERHSDDTWFMARQLTKSFGWGTVAVRELTHGLHAWNLAPKLEESIATAEYAASFCTRKWSGEDVWIAGVPNDQQQ